MNEMNFQMDGPMMTGSWYNPRTGDSFTVRDCFFQDNDLFVATTDGRMLNYNTIQEYVKSDKPLPKMPKDDKRQKAQVPASVEALIENDGAGDDSGGLLPEDAALLQGTPLPAPQQSPRPNTLIPQSSVEQLQASEDRRLIERILKRSDMPEIDAMIKWRNFPNKQLDCLLFMMGIDTEDIVTYYIDKLDVETIKQSLREQLLQSIEDKLYPKNEPNTPTENVGGEPVEDPVGEPVQEQDDAKPAKVSRKRKK